MTAPIRSVTPHFSIFFPMIEFLPAFHAFALFVVSKSIPRSYVEVAHIPAWTTMIDSKVEAIGFLRNLDLDSP